MQNLDDDGVVRTKLKLPDGANGVLVKNLYLSTDPYWDSHKKSVDLDSFTPKPDIQYGVAQVMDSSHPDFKKDDFVWGTTDWKEEHSLISNPKSLYKINHTDIPLSCYSEILGVTGFSAYVGFHKICSPKKGDYVFVSAASEAIGQLVGQFAKLLGCYVVGCADSKEKVDLLENKLGFDKAFNYKEEPDLEATLRRFFPEGIDIYFDYKGAKMLGAVLVNMRMCGRSALCATGPEEAVPDLKYLILKKAILQGFHANCYQRFYPEYLEFVLPYIKGGKIV